MDNQMFEDQQDGAQQEHVENMQQHEDQPAKPRRKKKMSSKAWIWILLVLAIVLGVSGAYKFMGGGVMSGNGYYAVFLDNNQVYFGNLSHKKSAYVVLEDVYYLRVTQVLQKNDQGQDVAVPDINLIKLGTELHKPVDKMEIQQDHILFIEELQKDSSILQAIDKYRGQQKDVSDNAKEEK
jgi:hypothetical protein